MTTRNGIGHMPNNQISSKINFIRIKLDLSLARLGDMTGYSGVHISRMEKGICNVTSEFIDRICQSVSVDRSYFDDDVAVEDIFKYLSDEDSIRNPRNIDHSDVGKRLRKIRTERGLNVKKMSEASGVDAGLISNIENHGKTLTLKQGKKLAEALEVGIDWLLYGDEDKKEFPVDDKMAEWLWEHKDYRRMIWENMKGK